MGDAWFIATHLFPLGRLDPLLLKVGGFSRATAPYLVLSIVAMFVVEWWIAHPSRVPRLWARPAFRALAYNACVSTRSCSSAFLAIATSSIFSFDYCP